MNEVTICNMALDRIGVTPIQSLAELSVAGRTCNRHYAQVRDTILRRHKWGFATKEAPLALLTDTYNGWDYAYQLPSDYLTARKVAEDTDTGTGYTGDNDTDDATITKIPYEIRASADGAKKVLLTNQEDAILIYTAKITDCNAFDSQFIEALVLKLASLMAYPLKRDRNMAKELFNEYRFTVGDAAQTDSNEEEIEENDDGDFVRARL